MRVQSISLIIFVVTFYSQAQQYSNWRGPDRDGIYHEQGLLEEWPEKGPETEWIFEGLGQGFSSPAFADGKIFLTGMSGQTGYVYILNNEGKLIKRYEYGPEFHESYPGSRSTPLLVENHLYLVTGMGVIMCLHAETGKVIWARDATGDFGGQNIRWGITENLIADGNKVFFTPGGKKYNIVALDRFTGELIWSSPGTGKGDLSAYCSPLLIELPARKILVTHMANDLVGVDAGTGEPLWSYPQTNRNSIHPNTPVYRDGSIYAFSERAGSVKLNLGSDGSSISVEWINARADPLQGGSVIVGNYSYAAGSTNRGWFCVDRETGETMWSSGELGWGAIIYSEGRLYIYSERGELALVRPNPEKFDIISQTRVNEGTEQHFAHPVIHNGRLYVRRGDALIVYNIKG